MLGQIFTLAGLGAVSGIAEADLEGRLRSLSQREFLRVDADPRSPERGQYAFVQALIREVAYNMMARADRKTRHLAAARYFEALGSDELAGALAGHYLAAHANSARRPGARGPRRPGPDRPPRGGRSGGLARRPRAGPPVLRAGADGRVRPGRRGDPPRARRRGRCRRRPGRGCGGALPRRDRAPGEGSGIAAARRASRPRTPARSSSRIASTTRSPCSLRRRTGSPTWPTIRAWPR